jgi:hypothetical protein
MPIFIGDAALVCLAEGASLNIMILFVSIKLVEFCKLLVCQKKLPQLNPPSVIHRQYMDRSAPDCRDTFEDRSPGSEMIGPIVTPRIKQRDDRPGKRIDPSQVRAFAEIAAVAGKSQIAVIIGPPCCLATMCSMWCASGQLS